MKTSSKIIIAAIGVVVVCSHRLRAVNTTPSESMPADERVAKILDSGGCIECHTANPPLPFYANWPIARKVITEDIVEGYKAFDIEPMLVAVGSGEP